MRGNSPYEWTSDSDEMEGIQGHGKGGYPTGEGSSGFRENKEWRDRSRSAHIPGQLESQPRREPETAWDEEKRQVRKVLAAKSAPPRKQKTGLEEDETKGWKLKPPRPKHNKQWNQLPKEKKTLGGSIEHEKINPPEEQLEEMDSPQMKDQEKGPQLRGRTGMRIRPDHPEDPEAHENKGQERKIKTQSSRTKRKEAECNPKWKKKYLL